MHKTDNKSLWKEEMSYGGDTWYMGRIFEELKNYACVWLISLGQNVPNSLTAGMGFHCLFVPSVT